MVIATVSRLHRQGTWFQPLRGSADNTHRMFGSANVDR